MLVLTRKENEKIMVGDNITITLVKMQDSQVRIGIEAPKDIPIWRKELYDRLRAGEKQRRDGSC